MPPSLAELVEGAAQARNEPAVARQHIEDALRRIEAGQEEVAKYPTGKPTLKGVYDLATKLEAEGATKN